MKYNTIGTSSLAAEGKKSTLTIYAEADSTRDKMLTTEAEVASIRKELEIVQRALKLQTKRCRHLVTEYTRRLQEKEQQYQSEKILRDDQLAKVLRALLIFEARLKQEQKFISHQLSEKDYIIKKQSNDIKRLLSEHYCKNCKTYYSPSSNMESLDSSSEYVITDYQSSNFESLDSSSETYATISEKDYSTKDRADSEMCKIDSDMNKNMFTKGKNKDSLGRRGKRITHRKSIGTYFEVLKLRNDNVSPFSNEDNTSNDYDNLDSLPPESISDKITMVSERIENTFNKRRGPEISDNEGNSDQNDSSINISQSEYNNTVISRKPVENYSEEMKDNSTAEEKGNEQTFKTTKITESIPVFDGDNETNDNWYASASDQDDEEHRDIYRNNPVLECMNQILLQNINDSISSPPKTPNVERKSQKRVKFSDEEANNDTIQEQETKATASHDNESENNYYETPIQKLPNFYETPQSIYSNDYEQILSKCSESFREESPTKAENRQEKEVNQLSTKKFNVVKTIDFERPDSKTSHFYVDMDVKSENDEQETKPLRKTKILRTPPALPPKPANLLSKYKIHALPNKSTKENCFSDAGLDSEPDYCSISELNLPTRKALKKINVVAEINTPPSANGINGENHSAKKPEKETESNSNNYDPVIVSEVVVPSLVVRKNLEKFNVQVAKQTSIKNSPRTKISDVDIPKLPQVSEIIIPDEVEPKQQEERISFDNYVKNNSQILKQKQVRHPIMMGSSVSALITGFNNQQLLSEINQNAEKPRSSRKMFSSFENSQNVDKHSNNESHNDSTLSFDNFDLSQNFEEFKLDDCEIGDDIPESPTNLSEETPNQISLECYEIPNSNFKPNSNSSRVELVRATNDALGIPQLNTSSVEQLRRKLEQQRNKISSNNENIQDIKPTTPTYEHFLECTGLSSKSILTPSRLLSNHKAMLKPKDVKLRSKAAKSNGIFEKNGKSTIKYWSEPYI